MSTRNINWKHVVAAVLITWSLFLLALNCGCQLDTQLNNSARFLQNDESAESRNSWSLGGLNR